MRKQFQRRRGGAFRTVTAFGLGAAIGSIVALLYAPAAGKITRRRLAMRAQDLKRQAARRLGRTQRQLVNRAGVVRERAQEWITDHMPHANGNGKHRAVRHA